MKNLLRHALVPALLLALAGCNTAIALTDAGTRVRRLTATETPTGCNLLGDVAIGIPPDAARPRTEDALVILMRNKAGEMGGNVLVVESSDERRPEQDPEPHWVGRGIAYRCPDEAPPTRALPTEGTAGGEEGAEPTEGDAAEADAESDALDGI